MSSEERKILQVSRANDADSDDNAQKISNVLGKRSPVEMEAIRASVPLQHPGQVAPPGDRPLAGGRQRGRGARGTTGNPVLAASVGIANADGNLELRYWAIQPKDEATAMELSDECVVGGTQGVGELDRDRLGQMLKQAGCEIPRVSNAVAITAAPARGRMDTLSTPKSPHRRRAIASTALRAQGGA